MNRYQLRADFEKSFQYLDKSYGFDLDRFFYLNPFTQQAWLAWVSSFTTYTNEQLTGSYASEAL